jgi:hypothetical protein
MREYTFIPLTYFMRHVRLGLIYRVKTTLKVLLALRVPEGELVYCGYDTLHGADGISLSSAMSIDDEEFARTPRRGYVPSHFA